MHGAILLLLGWLCGAERVRPGQVGGCVHKVGPVPTGCVGSSRHTYFRPSSLDHSLVLFSFSNPFLPSFPFPPLDPVISCLSCLPPFFPLSFPPPPSPQHPSCPDSGSWIWGVGGVGALQGREVQGTSCCGQLQDFQAKWLFQQLSLVKRHCRSPVYGTL